jgi:nucleoside-diphosphate-sugar epimerase
MRGCEAAVHLAGLTKSGESRAPETFEVNVTGTWNVVSRAVHLGLHRVVNMSSVNALGVFLGQSKPDYLPIDDEHAARPAGTYGLSKRLGEEICALLAARSGTTSVSLRPPAVWQESDYGRTAARYGRDPRSEWEPYWEYGAFLDVRDLASAVIQALTRPIEGDVTLLLAAADVTTNGRTSSQLAHDLLPDVEWRGGPEYESKPFRSLVDTSRARELLDWQPRHTWRDFVDSAASRKGVTLPWRR